MVRGFPLIFTTSVGFDASILVANPSTRWDLSVSWINYEGTSTQFYLRPSPVSFAELAVQEPGYSQYARRWKRFPHYGTVVESNKTRCWLTKTTDAVVYMHSLLCEFIENCSNMSDFIPTSEAGMGPASNWRVRAPLPPLVVDTVQVIISWNWLGFDLHNSPSSSQGSPSPPLDNIRVMVIVWRLRGNIIRTALCWIVWHNVHSPQHTYVSSSYRSNRSGLSHWDPYAVRRGGCLELYYCNMVEWFWWDSSLISTTNWFPSVLCHCWFGHLACKNHPQNDL